MSKLSDLTKDSVARGRLTCGCGTPVERYPNGEMFPSFYCPKCDTGDWAIDSKKGR